MWWTMLPSNRDGPDTDSPDSGYPRDLPRTAREGTVTGRVPAVADDGARASSAARGLHPYCAPGLLDDAVLGRALAVALGRRERGAGEDGEVGVLGEPAAGERVVPERPGAVPGGTADPGRDQVTWEDCFRALEFLRRFDYDPPMASFDAAVSS